MLSGQHPNTTNVDKLTPAPHDVESVYLDNVDGFGFERICEKIFERCGFGSVERLGGVADGGRDLIIHRNNGDSVIVECKHYLNSTVGRPIVQKLHSAVISSGAGGGIIVTTGSYSAAAVEHAKMISETSRSITLYDLHGLRDLAERAGIRLLVDGDAGSITCMKNSDVPTISRWFSNNHLEDVEGHPKHPMQMLNVRPLNMRLIPHYVASVDIDQEFTTSVGLIHSIDICGQVAVFDASGARNELLDKFFENAKTVDVSSITPVACPHVRGEFELDMSTLKRTIIDYMIEEHTVAVSYYGGNGRQYTKVCSPGPRSVHLNDIRHVFLPELTIKMTYAGWNNTGGNHNQKDTNRKKPKTYRCVLIENGRIIRVVRDDCAVCGVCDKHLNLAHTLFCNDCGNFAHKPGILSSESFRCHTCKKTICRYCTYWYRRFLLFKKKICESCANTTHNDKPKRRLSGS